MGAGYSFLGTFVKTQLEVEFDIIVSKNIEKMKTYYTYNANKLITFLKDANVLNIAREYLKITWNTKSGVSQIYKIEGSRICNKRNKFTLEILVIMENKSKYIMLFDPQKINKMINFYDIGYENIV